MFGLLTVISAVIVGYGIAMTAGDSFRAPLAADLPVPTQAPRRTAVLAMSDSDEPSPPAAATPQPRPTTPPAISSGLTPGPEPSPISRPSPAASPPAAAAPLERFLTESFDSAGGWLVRTTTRSSAGYAAGRYRLTLSDQPDLGVSIALPAEAYRLSADVSIRDGSAGLVFVAARPATFYRCLIDNAGRYVVQSRTQDVARNLTEWSESAALRRGPDAINRLRVDRIGRSVRCLANDQLLTELELPDESFNGQYGFALADDDGAAEASFDNLVGEYLPTQP